MLSDYRTTDRKPTPHSAEPIFPSSSLHRPAQALCSMRALVAWPYLGTLRRVSDARACRCGPPASKSR
ncbi:hypothetical protein NDU88_003159 [Pleurodeles waltl]|uniref:Uncharacterized protein n=1 Tax=Pleurodeles waltl TaxID=8319 RepID=A0AAV7L126_PLEWA|nr:hypothetical protein NDU88_003159 [Pleurodeles waltl]